MDFVRLGTHTVNLDYLDLIGRAGHVIPLRGDAATAVFAAVDRLARPATPEERDWLVPRLERRRRERTV